MTAFMAKVAELAPAGTSTLVGVVASLKSPLDRLTVTAEAVEPVRLSVPVAAFAPSASETEPGVNETCRLGGTSSFRIVPTAWLRSNVAAATVLRFTSNVSSASMAMSPVTFTVIEPLICPAGIRKVPLADT